MWFEKQKKYVQKEIMGRFKKGFEINLKKFTDLKKSFRQHHEQYMMDEETKQFIQDIEVDTNKEATVVGLINDGNREINELIG